MKPIKMLVDEIYNDFESRICKNCFYYQDEVCCNGDSPLATEFVNDGFGCNLFFKEKEK